jgi:uncharacterized membrane protein
MPKTSTKNKSRTVIAHKEVISTPEKTSPLSKLQTVLPWILIIGGIIGIFAAVMITVEKFDLASNPHYQPICDLNPIISCGSVMASKQAHVFGFMNTYIGLLGFPVLVTIGMGILAGAKFKRWFWQGMQIGLTFGIIFAYWLLFESMFRIRALCPYCLSVDVALTVVFWYVTLYNFCDGNLKLPTNLKGTGRFIKRHHLDILITWFILVIALILQHFWYYFGQHL